MGWQDAPVIDGGGNGRAMWESAPLVEEISQQVYTPDTINQMSGVYTPIDLSQLKQAAGQAMDYITEPLPVPESTGEFISKNLPQSLTRFPAATAVGTGKMLYNAAKKFTDPVVNAWSGRQDLGSAASDLFYAPSEAGKEILNALAYSTSAPLGIHGKEAAKEAWSDPAAAGAAIAPLAIGGMKGLKAYGEFIKPQPTMEGLQNELGRVVKQGFNKGIKPKGVPTNRTALLEEQRLQGEAVQSIVKGKEYLKFKDKFGEITEGQTPKNLDEFSQAIQQRKLSLIQEANEMNKAAGEMGVEVPLKNVVTELQKVVENPVIQDASPATVRYAQRKINQFLKRGVYTPEEAQEAMTIFNQSKAIAKANPTTVNVSNAQVDALIANNLRRELNDAVESATGSGYASKRKEFGALKSIEEPVNSRLKKFNQQNEASTLDIYDIFSVSDLLQGVLTGNPVTTAKGLGLAAMAKRIRLGRNPNVAVKKMFKKAESIYNRLQEYNTNPLGE